MNGPNHKKGHISSKLYGLLIAIFSASLLEPQNFAKRPLNRLNFAKNFVWFRVNTCDVVCEEDLKHFLSSPLGNEDDAKELFNIKQEFLLHYLLQLMVASGFT